MTTQDEAKEIAEKFIRDKIGTDFLCFIPVIAEALLTQHLRTLESEVVKNMRTCSDDDWCDHAEVKAYDAEVERVRGELKK